MTVESILNASGKRGAALSTIFGGLAALALAPYYLVFLLIPSFGYWFYRLHYAQSRSEVLWHSWCWGLGFFLVGLWWMVNPLWLFKEQYGWLIPFELVGINGGLALFPMLCGLGVYLAKGYLLKSRSVLQLMAVFVVLYTIMEWLRGTILTGFPWNLVGYSFGVSDWSMQVASLANIYVLTAASVLLALSPVAVVMMRAARWWLVLPALAVIAILLFGWQRLERADSGFSDISVRVVQANIPQELKWDPDYMQHALQKHIELSQAGRKGAARVIIWPETAFPFMLKEESEWPKLLADGLEPGQFLITGVVRSTGSGKDWKVYNSLVAIDHTGAIVAQYDKHHLVPFGEYVPLRQWLPLEKITAGAMDFTAGEPPRAFKLGENNAFLPLICYEVIFPRYSGADKKASWLLNLTNDGWFGNSGQPRQHLDMSRFRAIEQGKPMVRVANTGISAVIDAYGRVIGSIPYNQEGVLDTLLPNPLAR